jgi:hypothetical protein
MGLGSKSLGWALGLCVAWPFIVFLVFIKIGLPSFAPSWTKAAFLTVCAAAPCWAPRGVPIHSHSAAERRQCGVLDHSSVNNIA